MAEMDASVATIVLVFSAVVGVLSFLVFKLRILHRYMYELDEHSNRNGGELVGEVLKAHGVKFVFTLCGGHISPILVSCENLGIRVVDTRHEVTAVFAADAVARLSGVVGVAAVTAGPGLTNTVTAVKNAQMAESPVLLLGGAAATLLKGRGALQDIDQMSLFKPLCKYCATVTRVADIVPILRKAIQAAQSGTPGPVFVEFPIDTLYPYPLVKQESGLKENPRGLSQHLVNWYISNHLNGLFAGAWEPQDKDPLPVDVPLPGKFQIDECVKLVSKSVKPVVIIGSQATLPPVPAEKLKEALEGLSIPCFLGGMARGLLGRNSNLHVRQRRRDALKEADLVILAGTVCDFRLSYGRVLNKRSKIVAVNRNKGQLWKNSDMFWKPTVAIQGDPATFLLSLSQSLKGYNCPVDWVDMLKERDLEKEKANSFKSEESVKQYLNPLKLLHNLENVMATNSIIVADGGDFVGTAAYILRPRGPLTWLDPGAFGTLGVGGGFALGAKLCRPDAEVWIIYGDGSLGYSVAEFDTFTRHKTPVIALVGNDACWSQIAREQVPMFGSSIGCDLEFTDYHVVADGYGGKGFLLSDSSTPEIDATLTKAQETASGGKAVLINALIGKTDFRQGSISV
ncbi:2-hydroxyacyl-CoA lyase 2-like [Acropora millepora]|uniref:2-hydroxyacyl-CoA lyase 2-like n=1 Tax=Acropora millepora TaxID=45264 RepID=UPI001CF314AE|nr:2-hydroxyacyl-CoA lyase 2-like [Acropora millepora]